MGEPFFHLERAVVARIVNESLPTYSGPRLLEIRTHDNQQLVASVRDRFEPPRVFERRFGIVNGTRPNNQQLLVGLTFENLFDFMPLSQNGFAASTKRELTHELFGRNNRVITLDVLIESTFHAELVSQIDFSTEGASKVTALAPELTLSTAP